MALLGSAGGAHIAKLASRVGPPKKGEEGGRGRGKEEEREVESNRGRRRQGGRVGRREEGKEERKGMDMDIPNF